MTQNLALSAEDCTLVIANEGDGAAVFSNGRRVLTGHVSDVMERLIDALGINTEFVALDQFQYDNSRGWSGVKTSLEDMGL